MKKTTILTIVLLLTSLILSSCNLSFYRIEGGIKIQQNKDGTCFVRGIDDFKNTDITIPKASVKGNIIVSIGDEAFYNCDPITGISFEKGSQVSYIGTYAFYDCDFLERITIPKTVTSIGKCAFSSCDRLVDVYYTGTKEDWNKIDIGEDNDSLINATIHFNYVLEEQVSVF